MGLQMMLLLAQQSKNKITRQYHLSNFSTMKACSIVYILAHAGTQTTHKSLVCVNLLSIPSI